MDHFLSFYIQENIKPVFSAEAGFTLSGSFCWSDWKEMENDDAV